MARKGYERISQREYGRRLGVSNETIRKAIEAGKINKGWDKKEAKILFEKANEEWGNIYLAPEPGVAELTQHIQPYSPDKPQATKPQGQRPPVDPDDTQAAAISELENFNLNSRTPFADALRFEKIAKARLAELEMNKAIGTLVVKDAVYKELFAFGQEVRQALLVVPDRCIDAVLAAKNRSEAHSILSKEIHEALEKLTSPRLDFEPRQ